MHERPGRPHAEFLVGLGCVIWLEYVALRVLPERREPALGIVAFGDDGADPPRQPPQDAVHHIPFRSQAPGSGPDASTLGVRPGRPHGEDV